MPDENSRAYIYIIARLLKISKQSRILAVIFARKGLFQRFQRSMAGGESKSKGKYRKNPYLPSLLCELSVKCPAAYISQPRALAPRTAALAPSSSLTRILALPL